MSRSQRTDQTFMWGIGLNRLSPNQLRTIIYNKCRDIANLRNDLARSQDEVTNLNGGMTRKNLDIKELQQQLTATDDKHDEMQMRYATRISKLEAQIEVANKLTAQSSAHSSGSSMPGRRLEKLKTENATLRAALEDCKNRIFNMQPIDKVTDADITRKHEELREAIGNWVDSELERATGFLKAASLELLGPGFAYFHRAFLGGDIGVVEGFPDAKGLLTEMVIKEFLMDNILKSSVHFLGLDDTIENFLSGVRNNMQNQAATSGKFGSLICRHVLTLIR
jgi:hypothetical protein